MVLPVWGGKMSERKTNARWRTKERGVGGEEGRAPPHKRWESATVLSERLIQTWPGGLLAQRAANGDRAQVKIKHGRKQRGHIGSGYSQDVVFDPFIDKMMH